VNIPGLVQPCDYAHRGLWRGGGIPENSLAAFKAARVAGYGVELDVRLTADGEVVVFHDEALERLTVESGLVEERTVEELTSLRLLGSDQFIPTLAQALDVMDGQAPLLVELKTPKGQEGPLEAAVAALLGRYGGWRAVLSFNQMALRTFRGLKPDPSIHVGLNCATGPIDQGFAPADFISASTDFVSSADVQALRKSGVPAAAWTIRSQAQLDAVRFFTDICIFEGFTP
jgi:glycerophosphoryl diester phosphodiesterase